MLHTFEEARVQRPRFTFEHAAAHFNPGVSQTIEAAAGNFRVGVLHGRHHPRHAGMAQAVGTGRSVAMVAARFQRDVSRGATGQLARRTQGVDFGVGFTRAHVPAFADNLSVTHYHATDSRVGMGRIQAVARQFDGTRHVMGV